MDISGQFQEIRIVLTDDGFVSVLKQVTVPLVSAVEIDHISGKQSSHAGGEELIASAHQQMKMVRHQRQA